MGYEEQGRWPVKGKTGVGGGKHTGTSQWEIGGPEGKGVEGIENGGTGFGGTEEFVSRG